MTKIIMAQNLLLERQTSLISREGYWLIWKLVALWILKICIFFYQRDGALHVLCASGLWLADVSSPQQDCSSTFSCLETIQ